MKDFFKRYKWYLLACLLLYLIATLWLFVFTDTPQEVPFVYEVY